MLIRHVTAPVLDTNCYVVAADVGGPCVVIDPGAGAVELLEPILADLQLTVAAVVATHAHPDHVWDAAALLSPGDATSPTARALTLADPDRYRLDNPEADDVVGPQLGGMFSQLAGGLWRRPELDEAFDSRLLVGGGGPLIDGLATRVIPAPGHTEGSAILLFAGDWDEGSPLPDRNEGGSQREIAVVGDVIFAGSVGRTDLPGGDSEVMDQTLRTLAQVLNPDTVLLPGHGPVTTMRRELATNPFLQF